MHRLVDRAKTIAASPVVAILLWATAGFLLLILRIVYELLR